MIASLLALPFLIIVYWIDVKKRNGILNTKGSYDTDYKGRAY